jgi:protein-tyrosine phosphatase
MGNICRSPAAEGIFKKFVKNANLDQKIEVDSAGTIDYHEGELPDARMIKHAGRRGYILDSHARQFNPKKDFDRFDYIITMDDDNYADIVRNDYNKIYRNKIFKMTDFSSDNSVKRVPDPYYGGANGFENVLDILEDSTANLLNKIRADIERLDPK